MNRFDQLAAFLDRVPEDYHVPGCDCAIALDGEVVFRHRAGFSDAAGTRPVSASDTYWIYSATKVCTCTAALQLVERGLLSLDDPVSKYLPAFGRLTVRDGERVRPAEKTLRIWHLFTMTGGLDYDLQRPAMRRVIEKGGSTLDIVNAMADDPLCFEPGGRFLYSLCHDVLGAVVEVITAQPLSVYIHEHILAPLGMTDTTFHPTAEQLDRLSTQYTHVDPDYTLQLFSQSNPYRFNDRYDSGGAGLMSTVDDYIRLPAALSCGGLAANGCRVLRSETVELMRTPRLDSAQRQGFLTRSAADHAYSYGLGVRVLVDGSATAGTVGQFGWEGAAGALVIIDPAHRAALFYAQHVFASELTFQRLLPAIRELACAAWNSRPAS